MAGIIPTIPMSTEASISRRPASLMGWVKKCIISPWSGAALAASLVAFYASARGLQIGPGVEVIALTSVAANLTAIRRRHPGLP